jgi:hypothetical protein
MEIPYKIILQENPCKAPILQIRLGALHIHWNKFLPVLYERGQESASQEKKDKYSKDLSFVFDPHQKSVQQLTEIWPFTCKLFVIQVKKNLLYFYAQQGLLWHVSPDFGAYALSWTN